VSTESKKTAHTRLGGLSADETRATVVQGTTTRTLLTLAAKNDWDIEVVDVDNASLKGDIPEHREIYLQMPTGFSEQGTVCKLQKSLYGLKEAAFIWHLMLRDGLEYLGLKVAQHDECLFMSPDGSVYITAHVDDITAYGPKAKHYKQQIQQKFPVKEHNLAHYLGLEIKRDRATRTISIAQPTYTAQIIEEFGLLAQNSNLPISRHIKGIPGEEISQPSQAETHLFQRIVGKFMHLACQTRPDLQFAVSHASYYTTKPTSDAWRAIHEALATWQRHYHTASSSRAKTATPYSCNNTATHHTQLDPKDAASVEESHS